MERLRRVFQQHVFEDGARVPDIVEHMIAFSQNLPDRRPAVRDSLSVFEFLANTVQKVQHWSRPQFWGDPGGLPDDENMGAADRSENLKELNTAFRSAKCSAC
ncbi:MAG: hypothetical protein AAFW88_06505 [Pseudomonadota bacterium]